MPKSASAKAQEPLEQLLRRLIESGVIDSGYWGDITLHVRSGRLNHATFQQTVKFFTESSPDTMQEGTVRKTS